MEYRRGLLLLKKAIYTFYTVGIVGVRIPYLEG